MTINAWGSNKPAEVAFGGTGNSTLTIHSVLLGNSTSAVTQLANGTTGQVLKSVTGLDPTWAQVLLTTDVTGTLPVGNGGTGNTTFTAFSLITAGTTPTGAFQNVVGTGTTGQLLVATTGALPVWTNASTASSITITGDTGGAITSNAFTLAGGTTGLSFGGAGTTFTTTFAGITANGGTVSLATDATTSTINVGTGAGIKTSTFGSINSTSTTTVQSGSGLLQVVSTNGSMAILSGTGNLSISDDGAATLVKVGTGAGVKTVSLGSTNTTSTTTVQSGSGALAVTSTNGTLTVNSGTGALGISTDASATTLSIGTGGAVKGVTLGSTNSTSATTVQSGSGALAVTSTNGTLTINSGTGVLGISTDASATTVNVATGGAVKTSTFGSTNSTSATTIQNGSGALAITSTNGTITMNSGTGILAIANDATAQTVNIATGAGVKTTTLGSTNSTSATLIKGGTGASSFQPTTTGTLALGTTSTGNVSLGNTTGTTSIQFGTGSALSTFNDWTNFTPTIIGETAAGVTTYNNQQGRYCRVGNMVKCIIDVRSATMTGTGNLNIGGLPFTIANVIVSSGAVSLGGTITWPVGTTCLAVYGVPNTTTARINCSGSTVATAFLQMANLAVNIFAEITYAI